MKVTITSSGDLYKTKAWLLRAQAKGKSTATLNSIGESLVSSLRSVTPKKTGATASGWGYKVRRTSSGMEMYVYNNAHPETSANVALLLEYGHGTGTGGYVPPRHYIAGAVNGILNQGVSRLESDYK